MDSIPQEKIHRLTECKNSIHHPAAYKKHTSATKFYITYTVKCWTTFPNGLKRQPSEAILICNKIDFQPKRIDRNGKNTSYSSKKKSTKMMSQFLTPVPQMQGHLHL